MSALELELALLPGRELPEAISALQRAGLAPVPGLDAVPMRGEREVTWVLHVDGPAQLAGSACSAALTGVARVVGVFSSPQGAPFRP